MNLIELFDNHAAATPDTMAIIDARREITYQRLKLLSEYGAAGLCRHGLVPGDHVLIMVPMSIDLYVVVLATLRAGLVATFVDPGAGTKVVANLCERVQPKAFVGTAIASLLTLTQPALRRIPLRFNTGFAWRGQPWPATPAAFNTTPTPNDHSALVTCTSGSTGVPKIACRTHGFLRNQHDAIVKTTCPARGKREMVTLPVVALTTLGAGQTVIIPDADLRRPGDIDPSPVLKQVALHKPANVIASPAFLDCLLRATRAASALQTVDRFITGGGPVFPSLCERIASTCPNATLTNVYGSTEAEPIAELNWNDTSPADRHAMTAGQGLLAGHPVPDIQLRIITNRFGTARSDLSHVEFAAEALGVGEVGEIVVSGAHVLPGYIDGHGDSETKFRVGTSVWHRTGDAGALDHEGRLWLAGRADQAVSDSHGTCYPFAVETAAMSLSGIRRAAFAAADGARWLLYERDTPLSATERATLAWAGIDCFAQAAIPMDARHNSKVDHKALTALLRRLTR